MTADCRLRRAADRRPGLRRAAGDRRWRSLAVGGARPGRRSAGRSGDEGRRPATRRSRYYRKAVAGRPGQRELQDRAGARDAGRVARALREGAASSRSRTSSRRRCGEYQLASEYDPSNRQAAAKVAALDQTIRDRIEAARPQPADRAAARARARRDAPSRCSTRRRASRSTSAFTQRQHPRHPRLHRRRRPASTSPTTATCHGSPVTRAARRRHARAGAAADPDGQPARPTRCSTSASILVFPDNAQKHAQYDEQVIQTFYLSHADATELTQLLSTHHPRCPASPSSRRFSPTRRPTRSPSARPRRSSQIIERIIQQNDKPRAEIVVDVEILEVNRHAREAVRPEPVASTPSAASSRRKCRPARRTTTTTAPAPAARRRRTAGQSTPPTGVTSPPPFNLNTISRGISTADFYLAVPTAVVRFLESDTQTKLVAKPQLRGAEGHEADAEPRRRDAGRLDELHADCDRRRRRRIR